MNSRIFGMRLLVAAWLLLSALTASGASSIGTVAQLSGASVGSAQAPGAQERRLNAGDAVFAGERIRTGDRTVLQIEFSDRSRFTLGPNAEFEVEQYRHGAGDESFHSRIIKGAFRFVSGLIARTKRKDMRVSISVATIGIRGTHVEGEVTARREENGKTIDASAVVALLEPEQTGEASAIVVENKFGSVVIDQPGYGTEIPDEKSPPSPVRRMQLRTIDNVMRALRSSSRPGGPARPGRF